MGNTNSIIMCEGDTDFVLLQYLRKVSDSEQTKKAVSRDSKLL